MSRPFDCRKALRLGAAGPAAFALPARAAHPDEPIRIVVTFAAGGASDIVARVAGTPADFQGFVKRPVGTLQPVVEAIRAAL